MPQPGRRMLHTLATSALPAFVAMSLSGHADAAASACTTATHALAAGCAEKIAAEREVDRAACANLAAPGARAACSKAADAAVVEGLAECTAQAEARGTACAELGEAPYDPPLQPKAFSARVTNPYFPLRPGTERVFRGKGTLVRTKVLTKTARIAGIECSVVRDTAYVDGEIEEDTLDYYAQDRLGNVWYMGEATAEFSDGVSVSTEGSWIAGVDGAKPGIIMAASPEPGVTDRLEFAPDEAEDLARIEGFGFTVDVPYGRFENTLRTLETTPLEPELRERKYYARGVGLVLTVDLATGEREALASITPRP